MGILNDLKTEAGKILSGEIESRSREAEDQVFYRHHSKPALERIHKYLRDLVKQLEIIRPEIVSRFVIPGYGAVPAEQRIKNISIDSRDNLSRITLPVDNVVRNQEFSVMPMESADETRRYFESQGQQYSGWPIRDANNDLVGMRFSIFEFHITGGVTCESDLKARKILVRIRNMQGFCDYTEELDPERIDEEWLDKLGRFIIGEYTTRGQLEISEEARAAIRRKVEEARLRAAREEKELEAAVLSKVFGSNRKK